MRRIVCVLLSNWPIDRYGRRRNRGRPASLPEPLVLTRTVAGVRRVVAVSPEAHALGIREGFTLAQARALCARLVHAEHEPDRDRRALEVLGRWMMRFTPVVAVSRNGNSGPADPSPKPHLPPALLLDVTGCERAMGGLERILSRLRRALGAMGIGAAMAVGPTVGAAWALAFGKSRFSNLQSRISDLGSQISLLPPIALRLDAALTTSTRCCTLLPAIVRNVAPIARRPSYEVQTPNECAP